MEEMVPVHPLNRLRIKIGVEGQVPLFDLVDGQATPNGSYITLNNPCKLFIHQDDLNVNVAPGIYDMQIALLDRADSNNITLVAKGMFIVNGTVGAGDIPVE